MEVAIILNRCLVVLTEQNLCVHLPAHIFLFFFLSTPLSFSLPPSVCLFGYYYHHFSVCLVASIYPPLFRHEGGKTPPVFSVTAPWEVGWKICLLSSSSTSVFLYYVPKLYDKKRTHKVALWGRRSIVLLNHPE